MYIACARSVSEHVGLLLKTSYVVSDNFDLVLFLGYAFVVRGHAIAMDFFGTPKKGGLDPPSESAYGYDYIWSPLSLLVSSVLESF